MRILFVHQGFPGQFRHLAPALAANLNNEVVAMHMQPQAVSLPGVRSIAVTPERANGADTHPWLISTESKIIRGQASWRAAQALHEEGFVPDVIVVHPGWGEDLFLKQVWPSARMLCYFEYYYREQGGDVGFDPEFPVSVEDLCKLRLKNTGNLLSLEACDAGISPTAWQQSTYPAHYRHRIEVVHEGIDTDAIAPNTRAALQLPGLDVPLTRADEVITFASRHLEPYRGFHMFMRALPALLRARPSAQVLIVGAERGGYGAQSAQSWKETYLREVEDRIDLTRVHFLGQLTREQFTRVLQVSSVHVYLTVPFVLSWSMLEAMSAGCLVLGSRTAPVEEIIRDGVNGLLVDFLSPAGIVAGIEQVLDHPTRMQDLREAARRTIVERYDLKTVCLPRQMALIERLAGQGSVLDLLMQEGRAHHKAGRLEPARAAYRRVLELAPSHADATHFTGVLASQSGQLDEAVALIEQAIQRDASPAMYTNLGAIQLRAGRLGEAERALREALRRKPDQAEAWSNLGNVYRALAQAHRSDAYAEQAIDSYQRALAVEPGYADAHFNRAVTLLERKQPLLALAGFERAIALNSGHVGAWTNQGVALHALGRSVEAVASHEHAIALDPAQAEPYCNLGVSLNTLGRFDEAARAFERSAALKPDFAPAHWNRSLLHLLHGDFAAGWPGFEWRWRSDELSRTANRRPVPQPLWLGQESLAGKTILLQAEQGLGDTVQFSRYAPLVAALGATVLLEVQRPLRRLLDGLPGVSAILSQDEAPPPFNVYCPLLSLPLALGTQLTSIPAGVPYVQADPALASAWQARLGPKTRPRIGLAWYGRTTHKNDARRSMRLADLAPLFALDADFISLHQEQRAADASRPSNLRHVGGELRDLADTAALCAELDLIISVDTCMAHLAGAMGKPVWILLPWVPDWRWMLEREDSPWYPNARLFRQAGAGQWAGVIERVVRCCQDTIL